MTAVAVTAVIELLMMGGKTPETCSAVNKRQDNKLENCCTWLVIYLNYSMIIRLLLPLLRNRLTYSPQTDHLMAFLFLLPSHNARAYHSNTTRSQNYDATRMPANPSRLRPVQRLSSVV